MYVVTFYSFKGGVGRSLALMNVAHDLIQRGRRVLIVDFDLEAPGIPTFDTFESCTKKPGIVDYVSDYLVADKAPKILNYISECDAGKEHAGIWLMSAGLQDPSYASRLNSINWETLYSQRQGYLLFEDMKAQWKSEINPDYVLIDSRTGHTDVGGICTRQLPDAVVAMFFPNEQNQIGMERVVTDIRAEASSIPAKQINIHFVASNVPNLDDEDEILQNRLSQFQKRLGFEAPAAVIHHYASLTLLEQDVFVKTRPNSRLTTEYKDITSAIMKGNVRDREGVLANFEEWMQGHNPSRNDREIELSAITNNYAEDGEILLKVAAIRERENDWDAALSLLEKVIDLGHGTSEAFARRATIKLRKKNEAGAIKDFEESLSDERARYQDVGQAIRWLSQLEPKSLALVPTSKAFLSQDYLPQLELADRLRINRDMLPLMEQVYRRISLEAEEETVRYYAKRELNLTQIGAGKFHEAMDSIGQSHEIIKANGTLADVFNYAMAEWGATSTPPIDMFKRAVNLAVDVSNSNGANFLQCMAISNHFAGDSEKAANFLRRANAETEYNPRQVFSAWRYLLVSAEEFIADLKQIEKLIDGENMTPMYFTK